MSDVSAAINGLIETGKVEDGLSATLQEIISGDGIKISSSEVDDFLQQMTRPGTP